MLIRKVENAMIELPATAFQIAGTAAIRADEVVNAILTGLSSRDGFRRKDMSMEAWPR